MVGYAFDYLGEYASTEKAAETLSAPFREDRDIFLQRLEMAMDKINSMHFVDHSKVFLFFFK